MFQLRRILFPVDYSDRCRGAAAYVEALAGWFEAEFILLRVIEATYNSTLEDLHETQVENFDKFFGKSLKHPRVKTLVEHGEATQKIIECATAHQADLIMIPTQGMVIYRRLILGSTSAKTLHDADCPVWTGIHLENAPPLEAVAYQWIVCAVDLKPPRTRILDWASRLAEEYQAVVEHLQEEVGSRAAIRVDIGEASKTVAHLARESKADLLVIGRRAEPGVLGPLAMTAYNIIRQSPCSVVSV